MIKVLAVLAYELGSKTATDLPLVDEGEISAGFCAAVNAFVVVISMVFQCGLGKRNSKRMKAVDVRW